LYYLYSMKGTAINKEKQVVISEKEYNDLLALKNELLALRDAYSSLVSDYQYQRFQMSELQRMLFGVKSERFRSNKEDAFQLDLFAKEEVPEVKPEAEKTTVSYERSSEKEKKRPVRSALPEHLRREEEVIEPENVPEGAVKIGESITEVLEYKQAEVYVRVIVRPKYVIPGSEGEGCVVVAPQPSLPIPKGNAGSSLLAHICVSKFIDHLPFHRQIQIFKREKIPVAEATMKGWYAATCRLLEPLYETLKKEILKSDYLQVDESPMPVLTADKPGSTHKGYMWVFHAPVNGLVCFYYDKSRAGEVVRHFLGNYRGALQTDAYPGYDQYEDKEGICLLACAAHARRKIEHARSNSPTLSKEGLELFARLYRIEQEAREGKLTPEKRYALRNEKSRPVLDEMKSWLEKQRNKVLPKSATGDAVCYTLRIWERLNRYLLDGRYEIDNNLIENSIRPLALGRRNYLFSGSHEGAQCNAMMYSFFASCKRAEVNPSLWLKDVLDRIPEHHANKLDELLPNNWAKQMTAMER